MNQYIDTEYFSTISNRLFDIPSITVIGETLSSLEFNPCDSREHSYELDNVC
jgi:hypothetical protein